MQTSLTPAALAKYFDQTLLKAYVSEADFAAFCAESARYHFKMVAISSAPVAMCKRFLADSDVLVGAAIGFPLGQTTISAKVFETKQAIADGADEIDYVHNIVELKSGHYDYVEREIKTLAELCHDQEAILKVIIETCYLSDEQKVKACQLSESAGADFVKTSTGYGTAGAKIADVALMRRTVSDRVRVKASGGIRNLDTVLSCRAVGAARCGVSATEAIMEEAIRREQEGTLVMPENLTEMNGGY